jgi:hypothetical protein
MNELENCRRGKAKTERPGFHAHQHAQRLSRRPDYLRAQGAGCLGPKGWRELAEIGVDFRQRLINGLIGKVAAST